MASFTELRHELIDFFKHPAEIDATDDTFSEKFNFWSKLLTIDLALSFVLIIILLIIEGLGVQATENHEVLKMMQTYSTGVFLLLAVIFLPFIEELVFRLPLRNKYNPAFRLISLISGIFGKDRQVEINSAFDSIYKKYFKIIFYSSALIFALVHIFNYDFSWVTLLLIPLLIAPQFLFGMFAGFIRLKFGFMWGAFLHFAHNLVFISISLIALSADGTLKSAETDAPEMIFLSTKNASIEIKESTSFFLKTASAQFSEDSLYFEDYSLNEIITMLLDVRETQMKFENIPYSEYMVLKCKAKTLKDSVDLKTELLEQLKAHYNFKISQKTSSIRGLELFIADSVKFTQSSKAREDKPYDSHSSSSFGKLEITNMNLKSFAATLSSTMDIPVIFKGSSNRNINITFDTGSEEEIKKVLYDKLGLKFKDTKQEQSYYLVEGIE